MAKETLKTIDVFCAKCQAETPHTGVVDLNGELVFTCTVCEGFVKLPVGMTADEVHAYFAAHAEANVGQVSVQASHDLLDEVLSGTPAVSVASAADATSEEPAK